MYTAQFDTPNNQTFYACADITYVLASAFTTDIPCFNATEPPSASSTTSAAAGATSTSGSGNNTGSSSSSGGISKGAIAGAVVGSVIGVILLAVAGLWLYREGKKKQRLAMMEANARNVAWDDPRKASASENSVRLQNLR
jgi:hypothetical protein